MTVTHEVEKTSHPYVFFDHFDTIWRFEDISKAKTKRERERREKTIEHLFKDMKTRKTRFNYYFNPWGTGRRPSKPYYSHSIEGEDMEQLVRMTDEYKEKKKAEIIKEGSKKIKFDKDKLNNFNIEKVEINQYRYQSSDEMPLKNGQFIELKGEGEINFITKDDPDSIFRLSIYQSVNGTWLTSVQNEVYRGEEHFNSPLSGPCPFCNFHVEGTFSHRCDILSKNKKQLLQAVFSHPDTRLTYLMKYPDGIRLIDTRKTLEELDL